MATPLSQLVLDSEDARMLQLVGVIRGQQVAQTANRTSQRNDRSTTGSAESGSGSGSSKSSTGSSSSSSSSKSSSSGTKVDNKMATALKSLASVSGIPYAGLATGLAINAINGDSTSNIALGANSILGAINPVLGLASNALSVPEVAMAMAKFDTTLAESFAAYNPKVAKVLDINQADPAKNQEKLDKAMEIGKLLGIDTSTDQGRYEAAIAGLTTMAGGTVDTKGSNDSGSTVDRTQDPRDNTSSMSSSDN